MSTYCAQDVILNMEIRRCLRQSAGLLTQLSSCLGSDRGALKSQLHHWLDFGWGIFISPNFCLLIDPPKTNNPDSRGTGCCPEPQALSIQLHGSSKGNVASGLPPLLNSHPQSNQRPAIPLGLTSPQLPYVWPGAHLPSSQPLHTQQLHSPAIPWWPAEVCWGCFCPGNWCSRTGRCWGGGPSATSSPAAGPERWSPW